MDDWQCWMQGILIVVILWSLVVYLGNDSLDYDQKHQGQPGVRTLPPDQLDPHQEEDE